MITTLPNIKEIKNPRVKPLMQRGWAQGGIENHQREGGGKTWGDKVAAVPYKHAQHWPLIQKSLNKQDFICKNSPFLYQRACPETDEGKGARGID
jgi:hypothetical protein